MAHRVLRTLKKQFLFVCHKQGFTLLELILVLAIVSILIITAQKPLLEFHQTAMQEQEKIVIQQDFIAFLMLVKSELIQAGNGISSQSQKAVEVTENSLKFRADRNSDGDLGDKRETIAYRYDQQTLTLFRKSGNSAYQTLVESILALKFEILEGASSQTCIKVNVQVIIDAPEQETVLCQLVW